MLVADTIAVKMIVKAMLISISFDNHFGFEAGEIKYVPIAGNLAPEMKATLSP